MIKSILNTFLREPLLHFLLIGAGLFFIYYQMNSSSLQNDKSIHITKADLEKISTNWYNSKGRAPTLKEKEQLLDIFIQDQILYHEAISKGLDKNDETIRLHLVKKMKFVLDDRTIISEPTQTELENFLSNNSSKFVEESSISFNQVVFTPSKSSQDINKDANLFLERLKNSTSSKVSTVGDEVVLSEKGISNVFGKEFASIVFSLPTKSWQGPIKTKHGVHLIYIHSRTISQVPKLSDIKDRVTLEWRKTKRDESNEIFYKNLSKKYEIIIDDENVK